MSVISLLAIVLAFGLCGMLRMYHSAAAVQVRLSVALLAALLMAAVYALCFRMGGWLGALLRFEVAGVPAYEVPQNGYMLLALTVVVILKLLSPYLRRNPQPMVFDVRGFSGMLAMSVATGVDVLLMGVGVGMVADVRWPMWVLFGLVWLLAVLGAMFGRRQVALRPRRWMVVACLLLLVSVVGSVLF